MDSESSPPVNGEQNSTRREFIGRSATVAGGVAMLGGVGGSLVNAGAALASGAASVLTAAQMNTLTAVVDQLIPADALGPGAVEAGVPTYIDRALAGSYSSDLSAYQGLLAMFDASAQSLGAANFPGLTVDQQVTVLQDFEAGTPPGLPAADGTAAAGLFQLLLEHLREGMFGDPMYGGNQGLVGWDLIGYPGIQIVATEHQQAIGTVIKPSNKTAKSYGGKPYNGPPV